MSAGDLMPKLSIITINLNNVSGLQKTMESVFAQTFTDYEYIIIDGGSTDGSKEIIENNRNKFVYWVSEKDKGIYNAMNKGILKVKGEYILFLNSGDFFLNRESLNKLFSYSFNEDIVFWNMKNNTTGTDIFYEPKFRFSFFRHSTINHQSTIIKKILFDKYGMYNEELKIVADWEFFIKVIFLYNVTSRHLPVFVVQYDFESGISKNPNLGKIMERERSMVLNRFFSGFLDDYENADRLQDAYSERIKDSLKISRRIVAPIRKIRKILKKGFIWKS